MKSTVDTVEVAKFAQLSQQWWNTNGPLKTLHDINPARLNFISQSTTIRGQHVLDVGCGGGILSEGMASLGAIVTGLDVEKDAIECARTHALQRQYSIDYICQPIETYDAGPYDIITCMEMLEHVQEPFVVISHCARLLKPGGFLFLSTINRTIAAYSAAIIAAEYVLGLLPRQTHDYEKFIKPSELARYVREAGLEITGLSGLGYNPLTRKASLQDSVSVNYLLACQKR